MAYKTRHERRARGGKASETEPLHPEHGNQYNAQGSPESKEEYEHSDGFKHGGMTKRHKKKREHGGKVEGHAAKHHMGKRARGGATHPHVEMHLGEHHEKHTKDEHKGGDPHDRHGGERSGEYAREKRARGGHVKKRASGGSAPFSHAHHLSPPGNDKKTGPGEDTETIP